MRVTTAILIILLAGLSSFILAQDDGGGTGFQDPFRYPEESNTIAGGVGMTWIDNEPYTTVTLSPEFAVGKVGIGLHLQLLFDNDGNFKLRKDEYEDGEGILRAIRYIRVGQKYDPYYFRVGTLDRAFLGNGFLMWNYNNGSNYDKRRIGLEADLDFGKFGFESVFGSMAFSTVSGGNLFVRPFRFMENPVPILNRLRVYGTFVRDNQVTNNPPIDTTETQLSAYGFGTDLRWLDLPVLKSSVYADYGTINDFGSGQAVGISAIIPEIIAGLFSVGAKFEKRFIGDQFQPNIFGPLYELYRKTGILQTIAAAEKSEGYFGELSGHIINRVRLIGSFHKLNGIKGTGVMHLEASAPDLIPKIAAKAYYDKVGIETIEDARTLDPNSLLTAEVGYKINSFMLLSMIYQWYWVESEDPSCHQCYEPRERVEPRLSFVYRF